MDLAFGRDGTLYVLEIDHDGLLDGPPTARSSPFSRDGTKRQIELAPGTLTVPGGITVGRDGLYVTINAARQATDRCCGSGRVRRGQQRAMDCVVSRRERHVAWMGVTMPFAAPR